MAIISKVFRASFLPRLRMKIKKYNADRELDFSDDSDDGTKTYTEDQHPLDPLPPGMKLDFDPIPNSFFYYASGQHAPRAEQPSYMSYVQDEKIWHVFNANTITLGRMANKISYYLQGKNRPYYVHDRLQNTDKGDFVIVLNGKYPLLLGNKGKHKIYRSHSGQPGQMKELDIRQILSKAHWKRVVEQSVRGMLPKNKLQEQYLSRLHIFPEIYHSFEDIPQFISRPATDINQVFNPDSIIKSPDSKIIYVDDYEKLPEDMKKIKYEPDKMINTPYTEREERPRGRSLKDEKKIKRFWKVLRRYQVFDHRLNKFVVK